MYSSLHKAFYKIRTNIEEASKSNQIGEDIFFFIFDNRRYFLNHMNNENWTNNIIIKLLLIDYKQE